MARATLARALELMFGHEGGYSNVKTDSGGPTRYGITHKTLAAHRGVASVTAAQVKEMTLDEATKIYRSGYWTQSGGDLLPAGLDYAAFDFGVNSGPARAVKALQALVGVPADGNAGPQTLAAVEAYPGGVVKLIRDYCDERMAFLRSLKNPKTGFPVNGRGWTIRVTGKDPWGIYADAPGVVGNALALARGAAIEPNTSVNVQDQASPKAVPPEPNPWTKPEVLGPVGGVLGGLPAILSVQGPVQYVIAGGIALIILLGAFYAFRRIVRTPA